jgi:hypothetical protein
VAVSQNCVADAIKDCCAAGGEDLTIEELEVVGSNFNLVTNVDTYVVTSAGAGSTGGYQNGTWLNSGDVLQSIMDLIVYTDAAPTANSATTPAPWVQIQDVPYQRQDRISPFKGMYPVLRSRRGSVTTGSGSAIATLPLLFLRQVPNAPWTTYMVYRRMHPFTGSYPYSTTGFILPTEWEKPVVDLATALFYAGWLKEPERATEMRKQLGLAMDDNGKPIPGLLQTLMSKRSREARDGSNQQHVEFLR